MNDRIGHNLPPSMVETVGEVTRDLSNWLSEHPIIGNDDEAREAKLLLDRASLGLKDMDSERDALVRPLNEKVKSINAIYRDSKNLITGVLDELKRRFDTFLLREEAKRIAIAQDAARRATEAEQIAREAERVERETLEEADAGVAGLDILARTAEADKAFSDWQRSKREEILAERETKVRIGGGFRRALSLRNKETIIVSDPISAIQEIGLDNEGILDAIVTASRAYKKLKGRYPQGVGVYVERKS